MVRTITQYICDVCKKETTPDELKQLEHFPVLTGCNWTDGNVTTSEEVEFLNIEVCPECLKKVTNVYAGFRGQNMRIKNR